MPLNMEEYYIHLFLSLYQIYVEITPNGVFSLSCAVNSPGFYTEFGQICVT